MKWKRQGEAWSLVNEDEGLLLVYRSQAGQPENDWAVIGLAPNRVYLPAKYTDEEAKTVALHRLWERLNSLVNKMARIIEVPVEAT